MNVLLLMAGSSDAFKEAGYLYPKNLIEIDGLPLVQRVIENLSGILQKECKLICLVHREENRKNHTGAVIRLLIPEATAIEINGATAGAACTALLAIEHINNNEPLVIINGDQIVATDLAAIFEDFQARKLDGGIVVFEAVHPRWSYVKCNAEGLVVEAAEKRPISKLATAGVYYFARGQDFVEAAMLTIKKDAHVEGKFYVCPVYNQMLLKQAKIGISKISKSDYFSLANPQSLQSYEEFLRLKSTKELMCE